MASFPKTGVPAQRSSWYSLKVRRRLFFLLLFLVGLAGVFSLYAWLNQKPPVIPQPPETFTRATATATKVAEEYLKGLPLTVPADTGTADEWSTYVDSLKKQPTTFTKAGVPADVAGAPELYGVKETSVENTKAGTKDLVDQVRFVVPMTILKPDPSSTDPKALKPTTVYYELTIPMLYPDVNKDGVPEYPILGGMPYMAPLVQTVAKNVDADKNNINYEDAQTIAQFPGASGAVKDWAKAFTAASNSIDLAATDPDNEALRRAVGDTDTNHVYLGLGNWELFMPNGAKAANVDTAALDTANTALAVAAPNGFNGYVVTVPLKVANGTGGPVRTIKYDLLVSNQGTNSKVLAWGPQGSLNELTPYKNAVTDPPQ